MTIRERGGEVCLGDHHGCADVFGEDVYLGAGVDQERVG